MKSRQEQKNGDRKYEMFCWRESEVNPAQGFRIFVAANIIRPRLPLYEAYSVMTGINDKRRKL